LIGAEIHGGRKAGVAGVQLLIEGLSADGWWWWAREREVKESFVGTPIVNIGTLQRWFLTTKGTDG